LRKQDALIFNRTGCYVSNDSFDRFKIRRVIREKFAMNLSTSSSIVHLSKIVVRAHIRVDNMVAGSSAIRQSKTILARSCEGGGLRKRSCRRSRAFNGLPVEDGAPSHAVKSHTKSMFLRKLDNLGLAILLIKWPDAN
jgi:hypothetical protein